MNTRLQLSSNLRLQTELALLDFLDAPSLLGLRLLEMSLVRGMLKVSRGYNLTILRPHRLVEVLVLVLLGSFRFLAPLSEIIG